jgi:hypothetical protein
MIGSLQCGITGNEDVCDIDFLWSLPSSPENFRDYIQFVRGMTGANIHGCYLGLLSELDLQCVESFGVVYKLEAFFSISCRSLNLLALREGVKMRGSVVGATMLWRRRD